MFQINLILLPYTLLYTFIFSYILSFLAIYFNFQLYTFIFSYILSSLAIYFHFQLNMLFHGKKSRPLPRFFFSASRSWGPMGPQSGLAPYGLSGPMGPPNKIHYNLIFRAPIARMKMILRPVESPYHFLSSDSVKPSK